MRLFFRILGAFLILYASVSSVRLVTSKAEAVSDYDRGMFWGYLVLLSIGLLLLVILRNRGKSSSKQALYKQEEAL
jgi:hypothetical protein